MKTWRVTYTDKDEAKYASSMLCQAETMQDAVMQFEADAIVVSERFNGIADQHRCRAYSPTRNYYVEQV